MSAQRLSTLVTEQINAQHAGLHQISVRDLVSAMNDEDRIVASAVAAESESITALIECVIARLKGGGRLIYLGAGTSGRLGILDASECVPTFNASPDLIQGHIAGGDHALRNSIEGAEDSHSAGEIYLDVKSPKLYKKVRRFYENEGVVFSGDPLDDYEMLMEYVASDLEAVEA